MIEIFAYDLGAKQMILGITVETLPSILTNHHTVVWVDFEAPTPEETQVLRTVFALDELAIEDCIHPRQYPKLENYPEYLFLIIHGMLMPQDGQGCQTTELDCFLADRYLITYHDDQLPSIETSKKNLQTDRSPIGEGVSYLAYEILDHVIDSYLPVLDHFDTVLVQMELSIGKKPFLDKTAQEYLSLSRQILDLRRTSVKTQEAFYQLSHTHQKFIDADEIRLFKDIYDHVVRLVDMSERYQQTLRSILEIHLSLTSNKVNQVAQFLTVIATIMLPLSVITGIYGMNFDRMPFLHNPDGFYITMTFMGLIVIGMLYSFRKRGWI